MIPFFVHFDIDLFVISLSQHLSRINIRIFDVLKDFRYSKVNYLRKIRSAQKTIPFVINIRRSHMAGNLPLPELM